MRSSLGTLADWMPREAPPSAADASRVAENERARRQDEDLDRRDRVAHPLRICREAGVPARVLALLREGFDETPGVAAVRAWLASPRTFLVLAGAVGTGKSVAAGAAIKLSAPPWRHVCALYPGAARFTKSIDLVRMGTFDSDGWRDLAQAGVLAIDDLGAEPADDRGWALANIGALMDARYDGCARTVITTNLSADRFRERYGERVADRLREAGTYMLIPGSSLRRKPDAT